MIIGALGGSATRLTVQILRRAGVWMGDWVDQKTEDSLSFRVYLALHFNSLVANRDNPDISERDLRGLRRAVRVHLLEYPGQGMRWGWKNPRNMWLIPFLSKEYPDMRFIHVLRDGREMAQTGNDFLLSRHGRSILTGRFRLQTDDPVDAQLALWRIGNTFARDSALRCLPEGNYMQIRYEDLCEKPDVEVRRLREFLDLPDDESVVSDWASMIKPSKRIGRWRESEDPRLLSPASDVRDALSSFGYN